jgi:hypothetical protein
MEPLLTKEDVAVRARISVRTLDLYFKAGTGPRRTFVGKRAFVSEADCYEWILKRRRREGERTPADDRAEDTAA